LGILSQPFTITDLTNPIKDEKPLCGGSFKSAFSEKFKLSDTFDVAKSHEWTLYVSGEEPFVIESIARTKDKPGIRFWKKGDRSKGSGYIQRPAIFLSLKRLLPIGEDNKLEENSLQTLTTEEKDFFKDWHRRILLSFDQIKDTNYLESPDKNTLGVSTDLYDWRLNSSGQDNVGKILLAVLSFKRLKEKYPNDYKAGILAIDELDATLYPASQLKLIEALRRFASHYSIQIIFTTHSLTILEKISELETQHKTVPAIADQVKIIFLERVNDKIKIIDDINFNSIKHKLNVTINGDETRKVNVFTEDREGALFAKAILKSKASNLKFIDCTLGASSLVDLGYRKIPSFSFPQSIVFLDGDIRDQSATMKKVKGLKNFIVLPGGHSPERLLADYLHDLKDDSPVWNNVNPNFNKQYCFRDYTLADIQGNREKAKAWFNSHLKLWGTNATKIINPWIADNKQLVSQYLSEFIDTYNKFAKELSLIEL
jgi:hypothetical protein